MDAKCWHLLIISMNSVHGMFIMRSNVPQTSARHFGADSTGVVVSKTEWMQMTTTPTTKFLNRADSERIAAIIATLNALRGDE